MKKIVFALFTLAFIISGCDSHKDPKNNQTTANFRPPAYPLITSNPYFSIWAFQDTLYDGPTRHWTGKPQSLRGVIRVDGKAMTFLGQAIPQYKTILPLAAQKGSWKYTTSKPANGWQKPDFSTSNWHDAKGAFSDRHSGSSQWTTHDIWVRRTFTLNDTDFNDLLLNVVHDDGVTVYLNGEKAFNEKGAIGSPKKVKIREQAKKTLHKGKNVLAIHCVNTGGLAYLDVGLADKIPPKVQLATVQQKSVEVTATQTKYQFKTGPVDLQVTFTAPLLPKKLDVLSTPADYVSFKVHSNDRKKHHVQLYFSAAGNLAVNTPDQKVVWKQVPAKGLSVMRVGTAAQNVLGRKGDDVRIDWGYLYLASPGNNEETTAMAADGKSVQNFTDNGSLTLHDDTDMPRSAGNRPITLATAHDFGTVSSGSKETHVILAYDQLHPIEYFHHKLKAWWKRKPGMTAVKMLEEREQNYSKLMNESDHFDAKVAKKATAAGGAKYAKLVELAYRQSLAACQLAEGPNGKPLFFTKENSSNGDIATVDVIYPTSPLELYYNPKLLKAMLNPVFYYVESGHWTKTNAPHDLGTYPIANGRKHEETMPIEESGNMLIMSAALSKVEGNALYAKKHWKILTQWAHFLLKFGMDPKNQLTTDDFAGRTAHNANLSIKAIMGIASYGKMAGMLGKDQIAKTYVDTARSMAKKWIKKAKEGDHYKLTFTRDSTWSQKYNLVWNKVLGWNIFPDKVARNAIAYYLTKQNKYGLPLDSRATYTKSDWINWTATMAKDKSTFEKFIAPMFKAFSETKDRAPMTDWYQTTDASKEPFQARSVVGGYFMKMLQVRMDSQR
jgi:hypothetical protein